MMEKEKKLYILWVTGDPISSEKMVLMYAINSKINNLWNEVHVIIWGASAKLAAENKLIQDQIEVALHHGVKVSACKGCTEPLGVKDKLQWLGVDVRSVGEELTEALQQGYTVLTI
ncbi:MAG: DsrE family protein [Clostridia bacterium]|nr:DsrE family protein [Clostridia bacterium]